MLSTLLSSLQSQLASKGFVFGGAFPALILVLGNGFLLRRHSVAFRDWLATIQSLDEKTFLYVGLTTLILLVAYCLMAANSAMLEVLEGKWGPLAWIRNLVSAEMTSRRDSIEKYFNDRAAELRRIRTGRQGWIKALAAARIIGDQTGNVPAERPVDLVDELWKRRSDGREIESSRIQTAVAELMPLLAANSARKTTWLDAAHSRLLACIDYARDFQECERIRSFNQGHFTFPGSFPSGEDDADPSPARILSPTILGNIGRTMSSYAVSRYRMDLDILWLRLQSTVQRSMKEQYEGLQDAKAQLDFLVAGVWILGQITLTWTFLLGFYLAGASRLEFLAIGIGGFLATWIAYVLGCQSYRVFADAVRTLVDVARFQLAKDLHLELPGTLKDERAMWDKVGDLIGYDNPGLDVTYKHPDGGAA